MSSLYYCTNENNTCPKKEDCKRYVEAENNNTATLFKMACTEHNDYVLFMKHEKKETQETKENT